MRIVFFVAVAVLSGCDTAYRVCSGVLDEAACGEPFAPNEGAWVGTPTAWSDPCGEAAWSEGDWALSGASGSFRFAPPGGAEPVCTRVDRTYSCAATTEDGATVSHEGDFAGRSEAVGSVTLEGAQCSATADVSLVAAWRTVAGNPDANETAFSDWLDRLLPGGGGNTGGYVPGDCPRSYDEHEEGACEQGNAPVTVHNTTTGNLSLFQSDVYVDVLLAGEVWSGELCVDTIYAIGTDWGEENCLWTFRVESGENALVYPPP